MSAFVTQSADKERVAKVVASLSRLSGRGMFLYELAETGRNIQGHPLYSAVRYTRVVEIPDIEPSQPTPLFFTETP